MIRKPLVLGLYPEELPGTDYLSSNVPVKAMSTTSPPTAAEGDMYVVAPVGATGEFAGQENAVALFVQGAWVFHAPRMGDTAIVRSSPPVMYFFNGTTWEPFAGLANVAKTLVTPIIDSPANMLVGQDVIYTATNVDPNAAALNWEFDGNPIVVSGALIGSLSPTITVRWPVAGVYTAKVKSISGVADYTDSAWSAPDGIKIGILETPILSVPLTAAPYDDIVITAINIDPNATAITWEFSGSLTIVSGSLTGSLSPTITIQRSTVATHAVRAKYVGGNGWQDSAWTPYSYTTVQNKPALGVPTVTGPATATAGENVTFTATGVDPSATSLRWDFTGTPTIVAGSLTGSSALSITVCWRSTLSNTVRVQAIGDAAYANSPWSSYKSITLTKTALPTPIVNGPIKVPVGEPVTFTVSGVYPPGTTFDWSSWPGPAPTVIAGSMTGGTDQSITVMYTVADGYLMSAKANSIYPAIDSSIFSAGALTMVGFLPDPILEYPNKANFGEDIVIRVKNVDADVGSIVWLFTKPIPTVVSGSVDGSTDPVLVIRPFARGNTVVNVRFNVSNNPLYAPSGKASILISVV